ncbi:MAG: adenylate/guanylate cyclase domain-containing protein [Alphaproteobacteria bacterium]|nr:adenylate/guanylate cyclase domain-containing protein [Alphaproteobacteria bacterium]
MAKREARTETTYEIYVLEGRGWQLHARYRSNERDSAVAEGRDLDRRGEVGGVKVVKEVFYPDFNKTEESVIFVGHKASRSRQQQGDGDSGYSGDPFAQSEQSGRGASQAGSFSGLFIAWRIIVITIFSLGFGILLALATSMAMGYMARVGIGSGANAKNVVFIVFLLGVVVIALPMLTSLVITLTRTSSPSRPAPVARAKPRRKPRPEPEPEPEPEHDHGFDFDFKEKESFSSAYTVSPVNEFGEEIEEKAPWWRLSWFGKKTATDDEEETPSFPATLEAPDPQEEPAFQEVEHHDEEEEVEEETRQPDEDGEAPDFERHRMTVMRFLGGAIAAIKTVRPQLDAYTKFAVDLALAGACEVVAAKAGLGDADKRMILKDSVELIGTKPDLAQAFAEKYESYFVEARYKQMAELGREAMNRFMAGEPMPFMALPAALESWDKPQMKPGTQQSIMTIFFTDMVGSTDMTQEKGDIAAQEIVRRHNAIVRTALSEHAGTEIKHTGDGIMASCPTAPSAVQTCIDIQRAIASFNATNPPIPLQVRIGLNSGEPIVEENDLFGATVQLAARVCAQAKSGQILCSKSVVDLSRGREDFFTPLGEVMLKGFKEPVAVFDIAWDAAAPKQPTVPPVPAQQEAAAFVPVGTPPST